MQGLLRATFVTVYQFIAWPEIFSPADYSCRYLPQPQFQLLRMCSHVYVIIWIHFFMHFTQVCVITMCLFYSPNMLFYKWGHFIVLFYERCPLMSNVEKSFCWNNVYAGYWDWERERERERYRYIYRYLYLYIYAVPFSFINKCITVL